MTDNASQNNLELTALLADVTDEKERARLIRTWEKLGCLANPKQDTPPPSRELERIFAGVDEQMSDDELHMLAAAGMMQGTEGNDTLKGTMGQDFIEGLGGDDQIDGGYGDDWIDGGEGNDTLTGGQGSDTFHFSLNGGHDVITDFDPENDTLYLTWDDPDTRGSVVYDGENTIITYTGGSITIEGAKVSSSQIKIEVHGGDGNDILAAHRGVNITYGGDGDDTIYGKGGDDFLDGGDGNDTILGGEDNDVMYGGAGNDTMEGESGNDVLHGDAGEDTMDGGSGNDMLYGDQGDDTMTGGAGEDTLDGGSGDDRLYGGYDDEADVLTGGSGTDTYVFSANSGTDTITDFNPGEDYLNFLGAESINDITVSQDENGNTVVTFGDTTVILEGVSLTMEEVWARAITM